MILQGILTFNVEYSIFIGVDVVPGFRSKMDLVFEDDLEQDEEIHDPVTRYPTVNLEVNPDRVFRSKVNHLVK